MSSGILFDALMEQAGAGGAQEDAAIASASITEVIAGRVRGLRTAAGWSGAALAERLNERGIPWNRTTVAKLETGRRESITVQELLALAVVLEVPPVWLLTDPSAERAVPIAEGIELDPWAALLWLIGKQPLKKRPGRNWDEPALVLERLYALVAAVDKYRRHQRDVQELRSEARLDPRNGDIQRHLDENEPEVAWSLLDDLAKPLRELSDLEMPVPPLPADVRKRAEELGVELPAEKG
jgi:transcriptional regulator with XRE-family HTH domain